jgi:hypothetical protein
MQIFASECSICSCDRARVSSEKLIRLFVPSLFHTLVLRSFCVLLVLIVFIKGVEGGELAQPNVNKKPVKKPLGY